MTPRHSGERGDDERRSPFENFAEWASAATSSPQFFAVCVLVSARVPAI